MSGARRPNVILLVTDDQGYGDLSCHGNPALRTPALDGLAAQSMRLTQFHASPMCSPTRACLMTGRYEWRSGVHGTIAGRCIMREDEVTLADSLAGAGYRTGIFGKWHLGDHFPHRAMDRGFQESLVHGGGGIGETYDYWGNTYFSPTLCRNGTWERHEGYCTDVFFRAALRFIEADRDTPFFAYLPTNVPHGPLQVAEEYARPYRELGLAEDVARYYGMLANLDENVARLLARLDELGVAEQTILVFMSDNGSAANVQHFNAGMRGAKGGVYQGGIRVPCFIRWPGAVTPKDVETIAAHVDLLPTLLEACGVERPEGPPLDGRSLLPLLRGTGQATERRLFFQRANFQDVGQVYRQGSAVRQQRFKLVNGSELYDMGADHGESTDVAVGLPETVGRLAAAYEEWFASASAGLAEPVRIHAGTAAQETVLVNYRDWWNGEMRWRTWRQDVATERAATELEWNGHWQLHLARGGSYRVRVLKCHPAAERSLLRFRRGVARVHIGGAAATEQIEEGAASVDFRLTLPAGPTTLQTFLLGQRMDGGEVGAPFVQLEYAAGGMA